MHKQTQNEPEKAPFFQPFFIGLKPQKMAVFTTELTVFLLFSEA